MKSILFMVTNGAGLGHLTRALSVAKKIRRSDQSIHLIFYTTSMATDIIEKEGFTFYYVEPYSQISNVLSKKAWYQKLKDRLVGIVEKYSPRIIVYDGAFPYLSVLQSIRKQVKLIWIKRECDKIEFPNLCSVEAYFDLVIIPSEIWNLDCEENNRLRVRVSPIICVDENEAYEREVVRNYYSIEDDIQFCYVQLGSFYPYLDVAMMEHIIITLLSNPKVVVLWGQARGKILYKPKCDRVIEIESYPNSIYFHGIDYAVTAAGYNTFYELWYYQVPSIFIPNQSTIKDDQLKRANQVIELQVGEIASNQDEFSNAFHRLLQNRMNYQKRLKQLHFVNGANRAAELILAIYD